MQLQLQTRLQEALICIRVAYKMVPVSVTLRSYCEKHRRISVKVCSRIVHKHCALPLHMLMHTHIHVHTHTLIPARSVTRKLPFVHR